MQESHLHCGANRGCKYYISPGVMNMKSPSQFAASREPVFSASRRHREPSCSADCEGSDGPMLKPKKWIR